MLRTQTTVSGPGARRENISLSRAKAAILRARGTGHPRLHPNLKALLQAALSKKVTLTIGDKERILTKAAAGIEQLVDQFARGNRYGRRDLFDLADKLGLDLAASSKAALEDSPARR